MFSRRGRGGGDIPSAMRKRRLNHIPAPGNWVRASGLVANVKPGHQETWPDHDVDDRAPLGAVKNARTS